MTVSENPFFPGWRRRKDAEHDFRWFKENAERDIPTIIAEIPHFALLERYTGFAIHERDADAVQVGFGKRPMGRLTVEGVSASEDGANLVYSLGPTGDVAAMLFPAKSDLATVHEETIHLRIKRIGAQPLYDCLARDLKYLVAYERVTSLDTAPTIFERLTIGWLRFWNRMQIEGRTTTARVGEIAKMSTGRFISALITAILKPVAVLIVAYLLLRFGMADLADRLFPPQ